MQNQWDYQSASLLSILASNFSSFIFSQVSRFITNSSHMQSTTLHPNTNLCDLPLGRVCTHSLIRCCSLPISSLTFTPLQSSSLSSSPMIFLTYCTSLSTSRLKLRIVASYCFISNYFLADSVMLFSQRSIRPISSQARETVTKSPSATRLMPRDNTSINLAWLFRSRSLLKLFPRGVRVEMVFLSSLLCLWWPCAGCTCCAYCLFSALFSFSSFFPGETSCFILMGERTLAGVFILSESVVIVASDSLRGSLLGLRWLSLPSTNQQEKSSFQSARFLAFLVSILRMRVCTSAGTTGFQGKANYSCSTTKISLAMLLLSKGQYPNSILNKTTPSDQISALIVYGSPLSNSGAIQMGDPNIVLEIQSSDSNGLQNPKSASLIVPLCSRRFSGLRSRCIMLCRFSSLKASATCRKKDKAVAVGRAPCCLRNCSKLPPLQNSQTKQQLLVVLSISTQRMMWGWRSSVERILTSLKVPSFSLGHSWNLAACTILMATSSPVFMLRARKTVEQAPLPISACRLQFSMILPIIQ